MEENRFEPRKSRQLRGDWEFVFDTDSDGIDEKWYLPGANWPPETVSIDVPHVWQEVHGMQEFTGWGWYRRTIEIDESDLGESNVFLEFGAVDYYTILWINGTEVGRNRGGYLPFEFDISELVHAGENLLTVAVFDPDDLSEIPHGKQGDPWYTRVSGVWQDVQLHFQPEARIVDANVTPDLESKRAEVELIVEAGQFEAADLQATVRALYDGEIAAVDRVNLGDGTVCFLEIDDPRCWTPEAPDLYDLTVLLETTSGQRIDIFEDYFGMRSIEANGDEIYLNGEPIQIRGILDQGYYPRTLYRPGDTDIFKREIKKLKELGFNLARKHLKPAHPKYVEYADRLGLLLWQEPANPSVYTERSKSEVQAQIRNLIRRDYNRPSVIIWGLYNEEWGIGAPESEQSLWIDEEKQKYLKTLTQKVRGLDPSRVICDNSGWAHVETDLNDYHRYFVCPDRARGWENDLDHILNHRSDNYARKPEHDRDAPVVISELGTWGFPDLKLLYDTYDGKPPWFERTFPGDTMKRPDGVEDRFNELGLDEVFQDFDSFKECWQKRAIRSNEYLIEQIRKRDGISGYVLTEFTDVEWEFNGILNYDRKEKMFTERYEDINSEIKLLAEPDSHVVWGDEPLQLDISLINHTNDSISGHLVTTIDEFEFQERIEVEANSSLALDAVSIPIPSVDSIQWDEISLVLSDQNVTISTEVPVLISPPLSTLDTDAVVYATGPVASRLAELNVDVTHDLGRNVDIVIVEEFSSPIVEFLENGGTVIQIPGLDGRMSGSDIFDFRSLAQGEDWSLAGSLLYQDTPILADICRSRCLGWEFEGIYPYDVVSHLDLENDSVLVGYVVGWLANWGSPLVARSVERGTAISCSFRIRDAIGTHPTATTLITRLIEEF